MNGSSALLIESTLIPNLGPQGRNDPNRFNGKKVCWESEAPRGLFLCL